MKKIIFLLVTLLVASSGVYAQFGCSSGVVITNGYTQMGITTPGTGGIEDWNINPSGTSITSSYWDDDVYLFEYTAGTTAENISMTIFTRNSYNGIGIFDDCTGSEFSIELDAVGSSFNSNVSQTVSADIGPGNTVYIAVGQWGTPNDLDFDVTDFTVTQILCADPIALNASNLTPTSADLGWTENGTATTWDIEWGTTGFSPTGTPTIAGITSNPYTLTGLTAETSYDFYVRADCGADGLSAWVGPHTFTTPCVSTPAPWLDDVESHTATTSLGVSECWTATTQSAFDWNIDGSGSTPSTGTGPADANSGTNYFYVEATSGSTGDEAYLVSPIINVNALTDPALFFYYHMFGGDMGDLYIDVHDGTTWTNGVASILGEQQTSESDPWLQSVVNLSGYTGDIQVRFRAVKGADYESDISIDDIEIKEAPSCFDPSNLTATNLTSTTADLGWTENGTATTWDIEWGTAGFTPTGTPTNAGVTTNPYPLTGLTTDTSYDFYVRADCGSGDLSAWVGPYNFTTPLLVAPPLIEGFTTTTPSGWDTTGWNIGAVRGVTGNPGNNIYKNIYSSATTGSSFTTSAVGPITASMILSFDYIVALYSSPYGPPSAGTGDFVLEISTDYGASYTVLETVANDGTAGWQSKTYPLSAYAGEDVMFKITGNWVSEDWDMAFDNFFVDAAPTCDDPSSLTATNITDTTADLGWTENGTATTWDIEVGSAGFSPTGTPTTAGVTSNPYTLTGLTGGTSYDFYVRADCGVTDGVSIWSGPFTFTTDCSPFVTAPWSEDFENGGSIPNCWAQGAANSEDWEFSNSPEDHTGNAGTMNGSTTSGGYFAWVDDSTPSSLETTLESPMIDVSGLTVPKLEFYLISDNEGDPNGNVDFSVDVWDGAAWNEEFYFSDSNTLNGGWEKIEIYLTSLNITGPIQLRFIVDENNGGGFDDDVAIDDVAVVEGPACPEPTSLTATNFTANTADLGWQENGSATAWDIEWGSVGFTPTGTPTNPGVTTNPYTLSGLTPLTEYDYYVRADCGADESTWSGPYTFQTAADCSIYTLSVTTTDGSVCDEGSATLTATASGGGDDIFWYDAATGGNLVGVGSSFDTPSITATTSYWAAEVVNGGNLTGQANANPTTLSSSTSNVGGLLFNVTDPIIIVDVEVFGTNATGGDVTIELRDIDNGNEVIASTTATITGGGSTTTPIPHTVPLNFAVPAAGNYRINKSDATASVGLGYVSSANSSFPYPLGSSGEVTGGATLTGTSTLQYFFFNWTIQEAALCESTREETIATVYDIIDVEVSSDAVPTNSIAPGGNTNLTASSTNTDYTYAWTWSGGSDTGATINVSPSDDTTYTVTATDTVTGCETTAEITILVYDITQCTPLDITATTGGYVCEEGTTTLTATDSGSGDGIYWYDAATDGNLVGTGSSFETPSITTTTSYWAAEVLLENVPFTGLAEVTPTGTSSSTSSAGLRFSTTAPIVLVDVEVFSTTSTGGDITVELRDLDDNNAVLATATVTLPGGGTTSAPIAVTVPLNFQVPVGNFSLVKESGPGMRYQFSSSSNFPYQLADSGEITGGAFGNSTSISYYFFYNWTIEEVLFLCESPREEAIATVVDIDEVDVTATQTNINPGGNTDLTASSTNTNYTYAWTWDGGSDTGATINVSPTDHTTYTVTATDTVTGCEATNEITILVFDTTLCNPLDITATTGDTICIGETATLAATASGSGDVIYWYDDEFDGNLVGEGATFDTPALTSTTSYWAAEVLLGTGTATGQAKPAPIDTANTTLSNYGLAFEATENFTIVSVDVYPNTTGGSVTVELREDDGVTVLETLTVTVPPGDLLTPHTITLNFDVTPGNYRLMREGSTSLVREFEAAGGNVFPYPLDNNGEVNGGVFGSGAPNATYYFFYNWEITSEIFYCESDREEAIATVTSDDAPVGGANQDFYDGETLADLDVTGTNLIWYEDDLGTIVIPDTTLLVDGETYYVSQTVNGCESQLLAITVTEIFCDAPTALTEVDVTDTSVDVSWTASATETGGYAWYVFADGDDPLTDPSLFDGTVATGVTTVTITGLDPETDYDIYVSTLCSGGAESDLAGPLNVLTDLEPCEAPTNLVLVDIGETTVEISWTIPVNTGNVEGYGYLVMNQGDDPLVDTPVAEDFVPGATSTTTIITGLTADTPYDIYLVSVCDLINEYYSDPIKDTFTTDFVCEMPTAVTEVDVDVDSAEFSWTASATETNGYEWAVFNSGDDPLTDPAVATGTVATGVTSVIVTGLTDNTSYDFYVRTDCDPDGISDWEGPLAFVTDEATGVNDFDINSIVLYPNPMVDVVNISAQVEIEKVVIFSLTGQKLIELKVGSTETQINVSNFATGPYLLHLTTSTGKVGIFNLIKK